jgi:hypothetical protein
MVLSIDSEERCGHVLIVRCHLSDVAGFDHAIVHFPFVYHRIWIETVFPPFAEHLVSAVEYRLARALDKAVDCNRFTLSPEFVGSWVWTSCNMSMNILPELAFVSWSEQRKAHGVFRHESPSTSVHL